MGANNASSDAEAFKCSLDDMIFSSQAGIEATCFQQGLSANSNAVTKTITAQFTGATSQFPNDINSPSLCKQWYTLCFFSPPTTVNNCSSEPVENRKLGG